MSRVGRWNTTHFNVTNRHYFSINNVRTNGLTLCPLVWLPYVPESFEKSSHFGSTATFGLYYNFSVALCYFQKAKAGIEVKKELQQQLKTMIKDDESVKEMIMMVKEYMKKNNLPEQEVVIMVRK